MPGRKSLVLAISLIMLTGGVLLAYTYSSIVKAQTIAAQGTVLVPANTCQSIVFTPQSGGYYTFQVSTNMGTIQAFLNSENRTYGTYQNGTTVPQRPLINGSSGETGGSWYYANSAKPSPEYFIFSNPNSFSEEVNYKVTHNWTYNNYFDLLAGIALTALGAILLVITLLQNKLRDFNKALENQE